MVSLLPARSPPGLGDASEHPQRDQGVGRAARERLCRSLCLSGGSLARALAGDAARPRCSRCPCFAVVLSPAKSQPLVSEVPLKEEHLGQLLIILMG